MKYTCVDCGRSFVYAAKKTETTPQQDILTDDLKMNVLIQKTQSIETHICPFCQSLNFDEAKEQQPEIVSIKSVDIAEADEWIKKGYKVLDRYAKTVTVGQYSYVESKAIMAKTEKEASKNE